MHCIYIMAPRRPRSTSNVSASNIARAPTASPQLKKQFVLALDSIYQNNLNVIKRRDPSVVSILDQFSHVCLYNFNGKEKKWVREGYEGSIFIVEQYVHRSSSVRSPSLTARSVPTLQSMVFTS